MPRLEKKQIIAIVGFLVVLISIPVSFTLVKSTQIFKSRADELKNNKSLSQEASASSKFKLAPTKSPLDELNSLLGNTPTPSATGSASQTPAGDSTPTPTINLAFGPTLSLTVALEGRPGNDQVAKIFVGISGGAAKTNPKYLLTYTVDVPSSGFFSGISLAGLNPGSAYTAYIKGPSQIDKAVSFTMSPTESVLNSGQAITLLSGDLNEDNVIDNADLTIAKSVYGTTPTSSSWNARADINDDKIVNNWDIAYINKNFGKQGDTKAWISTPGATSSASLYVTNQGGPLIPYESISGSYWLRLP